MVKSEGILKKVPHQIRNRRKGCCCRWYYKISDTKQNCRQYINHNCILYVGIVIVVLADILLFVGASSDRWTLIILGVNVTKVDIPVDILNLYKEGFGLFSKCDDIDPPLCNTTDGIIFEDNEDVKNEIMWSLCFSTTSIILGILTPLVTSLAKTLGSCAGLSSGAAAFFAGIALTKWFNKVKKYVEGKGITYNEAIVNEDMIFGQPNLGWSWLVCVIGALLSAVGAFFLISGGNYVNKRYEDDILYDEAKDEKRFEIRERKMIERAREEREKAKKEAEAKAKKEAKAEELKRKESA